MTKTKVCFLVIPLYYDITVNKMLFCKTSSFLLYVNFAITKGNIINPRVSGPYL